MRVPAKFFPMSEFVYATQTKWQEKIAGMSEAEKAAVDQMTDQQRVVRFAELGGMGRDRREVRSDERTGAAMPCRS